VDATGGFFLDLLGISPYFQLPVKGLIIIGAVLLDRLRQEAA
jgi:ribose/xylose/arabinose/galactoside ABC-type transport system permease subunit